MKIKNNWPLKNELCKYMYIHVLFVDVNVHSILGLNDWYLLVMSDFCYVTKIDFTHAQI